MSDAITKFLTKLSKSEKAVIDATLEKIKLNDFKGLEVKKLTGHKDIFRIRKGKFRIIYQKTDSSYSIISIDRRSEATYRDF